MSNRTIAEILVKIFRRYDIALIQEIRDASGEAIHQLHEMINNCADCKQYGLELSDPLGRSNAKEQYGYFYRKDKVRILGTHQSQWSIQFGPRARNLWERPPFSIYFESIQDKTKFVFSGIHVRPTEAVPEIDYLVELYPVLKAQFNEEKIMFMGDFNAGCRYVPRYRWEEIRLRTQVTYQWYISDAEDTTVAISRCPYDRFVGRSMHANVVSSRVSRIDLEFNITRELARRVSDHWPIEFILKTK